ncbi:hypothetical protein ACQKQD_31920 [Methylobacterium sp. NPDC080182]|uniref:hypothetical protein n=1 Tax=Methylobacterium sp. NPDC080182 TaxID=3390590 RepID=UPI003CFE5772
MSDINDKIDEDALRAAIVAFVKGAAIAAISYIFIFYRTKDFDLAVIAPIACMIGTALIISRIWVAAKLQKSKN